MNSLKNKSNLSYGVNDNPFITTKIILRLKHIFAAFGGIIVVSLVISSLLGFDSTMSTAVILIGLTLLPVSMDWASGGDGASDYGSLTNISIAIFVMLLTLLLNRYGKGMLSSTSILIGMVVRYLICIPLVMVDFSAMFSSKLIAIPKICKYGVTFDLKSLIAFLPAYFAQSWNEDISIYIN